jgi:hypothetical protein
MERREFIALLGMAAAAMPQRASAEPHAPGSIAAQLVGTWSYASSVATRKDGTTFDRWGSAPRGIFMFDGAGNYAQIIVGSESRVFGSKTFCAFGTYKTDDAKRVLITKIEASSTARLAGLAQRREILLLTPTELKYSNLLINSNAIAEVLWKRIS